MLDRCAGMRRRVARKLKRWSTGAVTLTRSTPGVINPEKPWMPGEPTLDVYALDARVDGVIADYVNGTEILATDEMVIASPKARHTMHAGAAADGAVVDLEPRQSDVLTVDGARRTIKKVQAVPAAGPAAIFHIVIGS